MKARNLAESFKYAWIGLGQALANERNLRIHAAAAIGAVLLAAGLRVPAAEVALVAVASAMVIVAELVNTAIEGCVDLAMPGYSPLAARVKNIAAAAVLVTSIAAVVVGIVVFGPHLLSLIPVRK
ncbi:MAG: diacylglycerol kinase family protein [Firmicutes bacterium]|nr:diacylglycerol kinase family protein [Bacillota bacterium]